MGPPVGRAGPRFFQSPLLQPPLHKLFIPRPTPDHLPPVDGRPACSVPKLSPVSEYLGELWNSQPMDGASQSEDKKMKKELAEKKAKEIIEAGLANWNPKENQDATGDPIKTLFVGRLPYDITERQLKREFEVYGDILCVKMVKDQTSEKFKGYAFIEYKNEADMRSAYHDADAKKINGRRILVDVERGRTVEGWRPRRLGGGLGRTRVGGPDQNQRYSGRDPRGNPNGQQQHRERERSLSPPRSRRH